MGEQSHSTCPMNTGDKSLKRTAIDELKRLRDLYNSSPEKAPQSRRSPCGAPDSQLMKLRSCSVNQQEILQTNKRYYDELRSRYVVQKHENMNSMMSEEHSVAHVLVAKSRPINEILET